MTPSDVLRRATDSYAPYLGDDGHLNDPVIGMPTQYGTPYYALCNAVCAHLTEPPGRKAYLERAVAGARASLEMLNDPEVAPNISGIHRDNLETSMTNHRDFFWPPVMKACRVLRDLGAPEAGALLDEAARVVPERAFAQRPPSNWAAVWLSGEWLRFLEERSPFTRDDFDAALQTYFREAIHLEMGLYEEPGLPNSYDLFTRAHFADMLAHGYDGAMRPALEDLLRRGLARSFAVQLSDGTLASAYRSSGQTWNLGVQLLFFTHAANALAGTPDEARAREAAARTFDSFRRWQRPDGPYSPVINVLPPSWRVGYEGYTADAHYGSLAMGFLAGAILAGFDGAAEVRAREATRHIEREPTARALVHAGRYSVQVNARPERKYDAFGITELTFGPGRVFHFGPPVTHMEWGRRYVPGVALRSDRDVSYLEVLAHRDYRPQPGYTALEDTAFRFVGVTEEPESLPVRVEVAANAEGVCVTEGTPGRGGWKTLLLPYLRDAGTGVQTAVTRDGATIVFRHGEEAVEVVVEAPVGRAWDLPHGYENRRGLCGLYRVDLAEPCDLVTWRARVID